MVKITRSDKETIAYGKKIAATLKPGDIVCLYGDLGAGKTTLVKGIAQGLGVKKNITSPTFAILNVLPVRNSKFKVCKLVHIDTYRLKNEQELIDIGAEDYLGAPDAICVIEWPEKMKKLLKNKKCVNIRIEHGDKSKRKLTISNF